MDNYPKRGGKNKCPVLHILARLNFKISKDKNLHQYRVKFVAPMEIIQKVPWEQQI